MPPVADELEEVGMTSVIPFMGEEMGIDEGSILLQVFNWLVSCLSSWFLTPFFNTIKIRINSSLNYRV